MNERGCGYENPEALFPVEPSEFDAVGCPSEEASTFPSDPRPGPLAGRSIVIEVSSSTVYSGGGGRSPPEEGRTLANSDAGVVRRVEFVVGMGVASPSACVMRGS